MTVQEQPGKAPAVARAQRFALRAEQVFDGRGFLGATTVVVEDGRIAAMQPAEQPIADSLEVVDLGTGTTLLPGLVDAHVHLAFDASLAPVASMCRLSDDELTEQMRAAAYTTLSAGITTVRDLGDRRYLSLPLRDELASRPDAGSRLLCAGPPITTPRGHCWFLGGAVASDADLPAAVEEHARRGVDVVKVMATGGEMTEGTSSGAVQFDADALRVVVTEAHRHSLPVAAHAHAPAGIAHALAAGVDTIEHCSFLTGDDIEPDGDLIAALAASGAIVSLTLGFAPGAPPPPPKITALMPKVIDLVRRLAAAGVAITVGTDAGIGPPKPHGVLPYGAAQYADVTGDRTAALAAVTSVAARACGLGDRAGSIAVGYDADLVAVRGDPRADVRALTEVAAVYRSGVRVRGVT